MASLASTLYAAHRSALSDPTSVPAWGNAPTEEREAWERVAEAATQPVTLPPADIVTIDMDEGRLTLRLTFTDADLCRAVLDGQRDFNHSAYQTFEDSVARRIATWVARWPDLAEAIRAGQWRRTQQATTAMVAPKESVTLVFAAEQQGVTDLHGDVVEPLSFGWAAPPWKPSDEPKLVGEVHYTNEALLEAVRAGQNCARCDHPRRMHQLVATAGCMDGPPRCECVAFIERAP